MTELINTIKEKRQQEILEGKNYWTIPPLYVVFDMNYTVTNHDSDYSQSTTVFDMSDEYIRISKDDNYNEIKVSYNNLDDWDDDVIIDDIEYGSVVKKSYHDKFITVCFTRKAAEEFIERERHNLKRPNIYVHSIERRNIELIEIGKLFGDK